jgi:hypothetical protein
MKMAKIEDIENLELGESCRGKINTSFLNLDGAEQALAALQVQVDELIEVNEWLSDVVASKGIDENSIPVPVNIPPDDIWYDVATLQKSGLVDGVYVISASMIIEPNQVKQPYQVRQMDDGVAYGGISEYASDNTNRTMQAYRTYYTVVNGVMDFKVQGSVPSGASSEIMVYSYTLLDYQMFLPTGGASAGSIGNKPPA